MAIINAILVLFVSLALASCGSSTDEPTSGFVPPSSNSAVSLGIPVQYAPPADVPGFPESEAVLNSYLAQFNETAMRRHAWAAWAALTATTEFGLPVMFTWYGNSEVFGEGLIEDPRLLNPTFLVGPPDNYGNGDPPISYNVYNQAYRDHVRSQGYQWRDTLLALLGQQPEIVDFPTEAVAVKLVWWPVRHDGLTAFPVWDDELTRPTEWGTGIGLLVDQGYFGAVSPEQEQELKSHERHGNEWGVFSRVVAIDPSSTQHGATAEILFFDPEALNYDQILPRQASVVPLEDFFHFQLNDPVTVQRLNDGLMGQMAELFWGRRLTEQDYLALVAVHITTREIEDWVWTTFWWHDEPQAGPYGQDRPTSLPSPFDRYLMGVSQSADLPPASDGGPQINYNPYIEGGFALGSQSNCIACHQKAGFTPDGPQDSFPVERGSKPDDDPFFDGKLRTHLLWSLVSRPQ